jgi:hypothetical protein
VKLAGAAAVRVEVLDNEVALGDVEPAGRCVSWVASGVDEGDGVGCYLPARL